MGNSVVALNQTNVSLRIRVLDDSDGTPKTDLTASSTGHLIWYQRGMDNAVVTDSGSAADLSALTDAHSDWGFIHIQDGFYRVDLPDAAFAEGVGSVMVGMNATGFTGISETVIIEPLYKFQGQASSVTATTTTFPSGTEPYKGDTIYVTDGTGIKQSVLITSVSGQVATHEVWPDTNISATTSTILLIAGEGATKADAAVNSDASVAARPTTAQVNAEVDTAIADAGLSTASKMLGYFKLLMRSDSAPATDQLTELNEINSDDGSGGGTYDNTQPKQANVVEVLSTDLSEGAADNNRSIGY